MDEVKAIIGMNNQNFIQKTKTILQQQGVNIIYATTDGYEFLRKTRALNVDIAIVDFDISPINGYEIVKILIEDDISDVILIIKNIHQIMDKDLKRNTRLTLLVRPISKEILINTIEIISKNRIREKQLKNEVLNLKEKLVERKVIEKAKGIIMAKMNLSEEEAFKLIRKQSMDKRIEMKRIAQKIISRNDIISD